MFRAGRLDLQGLPLPHSLLPIFSFRLEIVYCQLPTTKCGAPLLVLKLWLSNISIHLNAIEMAYFNLPDLHWNRKTCCGRNSVEEVLILTPVTMTTQARTSVFSALTPGDPLPGAEASAHEQKSIAWKTGSRCWSWPRFIAIQNLDFGEVGGFP